jgi:hypothetical protein
MLAMCLAPNQRPVAAQSPEVSAPGAATSKPPQVRRVPDSGQKVCQVTGDVDRERHTATTALTQSRANLAAADLGIPVQRGERLFVYFGDSQSSQLINRYRLRDEDSIGVSNQPAPGNCLGLGIVTAPDGSFLPPQVPGVSLGSYEVPTGGFSLNGSVYVFFATDSTAEQAMSRSVLAKSDDGVHFRVLYYVSRDKFINVAPVVVNSAAIPGLPGEGGIGVVLVASGRYRVSDPYLAYVPITSLDTRGPWYYFAGTDAAGQPRWSVHEAEAAPLFHQPCIGELSLDWNGFLRSWVMLYNCVDELRGIVYRVAADPWGPWSGAAVLFAPWEDAGYCTFMHSNWEYFICDEVADPWRDYDWGGEYGPYMVNRLTTGDSSAATVRTTLYYLMSTWNPYQTVLMRATLEAPAAQLPVRRSPLLPP